jgi:hypothetical protein
MKDIPGYEIVEGECEDCAFNDDIYKCDSIVNCHAFKCYKKKEPDTIETIIDTEKVNISINGQKVEEKSMTHGEAIELIQYEKDGGVLEAATSPIFGWFIKRKDAPFDFVNLQYRKKSEPKIIPWTADDWREFKNIEIYFDEVPYYVYAWSDEGMFFATMENDFKINRAYTLLKECKDTNGKPCGKVVEE